MLKIVDEFIEVVKLSFAWSGRFNRKQFVTLFFGLFLINLLIVFSFMLLGLDISINSRLLLIWFFILTIINAFASIRRFHDLDKSGWYVLLLFIPAIQWLVLLYLLLKKGKELGKTRWG
ncbi:MAG: DUF805 domain-containing protein [Candidatus Methanoperedens sp.]|nr:DUF805 domain-containing protein [Candidatus Methanoperedens sp.]